MKFELNEKQIASLNEWIKSKSKLYCGAIGGRFTYTFTPTSLGEIIKVKDNREGNEIALTAYESW